MDMRSFFALVLPEEGVRFITVPRQFDKEVEGKTKTVHWHQHYAATSLSALVDLAEIHSDKGDEVYFACAAFKQAEYVNAKGKKAYREEANALGAKAFWLDLDCGTHKNGRQKDYPDQKSAILAVVDMCRRVRLPSPLIVSSGNGVHCYWPLTETITVAQWQKIARVYRSVLKHFAFKFDPSRDQDISSILRPPGTYNRKDPEHPKQVRVLKAPSQILTPAGFAQVLAQAVKDHCIQMEEVKVAAKDRKLPSLNDELMLPPEEYPPTSALQIAEHCGQLALFRDTGSDHEPHWRACLGIVKHCVEGAELAHAWSAQYDGYDADECQEKLENWYTGPATCSQFGDHKGLCSVCKYYPSLNSPIRLGFQQVEGTAEIPAELMDSAPEGAESVTWELPEPYTEYQGGVGVQVTNQEGVISTLPVSDVLFMPTSRFKDHSLGMVMGFKSRTRMRRDGSWEWTEFTLPTQLVGERGKGLMGALARHEIIAKPGAARFLEDYVASYADKLRRDVEQTNAYRSFGWHGDDFLVGQTLYRADGGISRVVIGGEASTNYLPAFEGLKGDAARWAELVNQAYNHPGHEQFQFIACSGFGAPLVHLLGLDSGCPIVMYSPNPGQGKTTAARVALSIYGHPGKMMVTWKTGATFNAALKRTAVYKNLPCLFDEFTNAAGKELSDAVFAFANGCDKERLDTKGRLVQEVSFWRTLTYLAANKSLRMELANHKDNAAAELARIFEINWQEKISAIHKNDMMEIITELEQHAGAAGQVYLRWLVTHKEEALKLVLQLQRKIDADVDLGASERFWSLQLAASLAGAFLARKLGLVQFDFAGLYKYAVTQVRDNLGTLGELVSDPLDSFAQMLNSFAPHIIVTSTEGGLRGADSAIDLGNFNREPYGRVILDEGSLMLSIPAVRKWCGERGVDTAAMLNVLRRRGWVKRENAKLFLGRGTTLVTGQVRCWFLDYNAITDSKAVGDKIVELKAVRG